MVYVFSPWLNTFLMLEYTKYEPWLCSVNFDLVTDSVKSIFGSYGDIDIVK